MEVLKGLIGQSGTNSLQSYKITFQSVNMLNKYKLEAIQIRERRVQIFLRYKNASEKVAKLKEQAKLNSHKELEKLQKECAHAHVVLGTCAYCGAAIAKD